MKLFLRVLNEPSKFPEEVIIASLREAFKYGRRYEAVIKKMLQDPEFRVPVTIKIPSRMRGLVRKDAEEKKGTGRSARPGSARVLKSTGRCSIYIKSYGVVPARFDVRGTVVMIEPLKKGTAAYAIPTEFFFGAVRSGEKYLNLDEVPFKRYYHRGKSIEIIAGK